MRRTRRRRAGDRSSRARSSRILVFREDLLHAAELARVLALGRDRGRAAGADADVGGDAGGAFGVHGGVAVVDGLGDRRPRAFCGRVEVEWRWEVSGGKGAEKGQKGTADLG